MAVAFPHFVRSHHLVVFVLNDVAVPYAETFLVETGPDPVTSQLALSSTVVRVETEQGV